MGGRRGLLPPAGSFMMTQQHRRGPLPGFDSGSIPFMDVLDHFYEGVMITDADGIVVYFNATQTRIDDLSPEEVIGRKVTDVYHVDEGISPTMQCLRSGKSVDNLACYYRTPTGKVVNSIHNVYPLRQNGAVIGSICFVRDYRLIEQTYEAVSGAEGRQDLKAHALPGMPQQKKRRANGTRFAFADIVGRNPDLQRAIASARMAAASPSPVMLFGETGTGKELLAQSIHNHSPRRNRPYIAVNCAAIPENLLEGILFGTSRGAFTGAIDKAGLFEQASGGTILLDEINSMSQGLQAKLLRALQERKIRRVGSLNEIDIDLKIISSVNREPHLAIAEGAMRPDLLYRLGVVFIQIPPLRDRMDDLGLLVGHFLAKCNRTLAKRITAVSDRVLTLFENYHWPGNIRELEHVIEGAMNMAASGEDIEVRHLSVHMGQFAGQLERAESPVAVPTPEPQKGRVRYVFPAEAAEAVRPKNLVERQSDREVDAIRQALSQSGGHAARAARSLGISPQLLNYKLKKYGIDRKRFRNEK